MKSGYVLAGFETLATIMDNFIENRRGRWDNNFTRQDISNFLSNTASGFLHSFGQDFPGKKNYDKYNQKEADLFTKCRGLGIFDNCNLIADSGGFQISIGRLTRQESFTLYNLYYEWLENYVDVYDRAFILDIPPGPGCEIFKNFDDVYKMNLDSYQRAKNLPANVRDKIIYVHHFRTPQLWNIYTKILRDYDMFNSFQYHATGGIVANMASDITIPCIIYILPLIPLLNEAIKYKRNYLNFHILGGANFRDVMFYELFKIIVERKHKITLNLTYDSSGIYKQVMFARYTHAIDDCGNICKLNIKSDNIDNKFIKNNVYDRGLNEEVIVKDKLQKLYDTMCERWNFKKINVDGIYDPERDTFWEDVKVYSMLYTFDFYTEFQNKMRSFAEKVYDIFEAGDEKTLYEECLKTTLSINQGRMTKKQKIKAHSIYKSLDVLAKLDEDYCYHLVNRFLAKDEFIDLDDRTKVLTI